jgi:2-polyprenyl-6-hydroxyphenyl methylase/3-demethylubiquinone-9 3-methyltransferase
VGAERFEFGENWQSYAALVDEERIVAAQDRLAAFLGTRDLSGRGVLDIGCGSGLHTLAALRLGASEVTAVDLDANSVAAARSVLERFWTGRAPILRQASVFELASEGIGAFDIVYSWGVLHHTGDMNRAIRAAAAHVKPGGLLALALYGKTPYCGIWKRIKRWYVHATPAQKARAEAAYVKLFAGYLRLRGKRLADHVAGYGKKRGMEFLHDVRDWIGGYPYESIAPRELARLVEPLGFELVTQNVRRRSGLFGSGNDEYLYRRCAASSA